MITNNWINQVCIAASLKEHKEQLAYIKERGYTITRISVADGAYYIMFIAPEEINY